MQKSCTFRNKKCSFHGGDREIWTLAPISRPTPLAGEPLHQLGYVSKFLFWRNGWDSNPRVLSDKRFSRPPRYDLFDTVPYIFLIPLLYRTIVPLSIACRMIRLLSLLAKLTSSPLTEWACCGRFSVTVLCRNGQNLPRFFMLLVCRCNYMYRKENSPNFCRGCT